MDIKEARKHVFLKSGKDNAQDFNDTLYKDYMRGAFGWISASSKEMAFGECNNGSWESAYALNYMLDLREIALEKGDSELVQRIEKESKKTLDWLRRSEDGGNWDDDFQNTALIARSLLKFIRSGIEENEDNVQLLRKTLDWLLSGLDYDSGLLHKYGFSAIDYAKMTSLLIDLDDWGRDLGLKADIGEVIHKLAMLMDALKDETEIDICWSRSREPKKEKIINWMDDLTTASVSKALGDYLLYLGRNPDESIHGNRVEWVYRVYRILKLTQRGLEISQTSEGTWEDDEHTLKSLTAYLNIFDALRSYENSRKIPADKGMLRFDDAKIDDHRVFKTIRWILDPKHRYDDGSYMHSSLLTVYFCETMTTIYRKWEFGRKRDILEIYDDVLWMMPSRTSQERGRSVQLELNLETDRIEMEKMRSALSVRKYLVVIISAVFLILIMAVLLGAVSMTIENITVLSLIAAIILPLSTIVGTMIKK